VLSLWYRGLVAHEVLFSLTKGLHCQKTVLVDNVTDLWPTIDYLLARSELVEARVPLESFFLLINLMER